MDYRFIGEWIIPIAAIILAIAVEIVPIEFWGELWGDMGKAARFVSELIQGRLEHR